MSNPAREAEQTGWGTWKLVNFRPSAAISARVAGVPYISVVNAYMTDYFDPVDVMIPKEKSGARHAIASIAGKAIQAVQKRALASPFRAAAKKLRDREVRGPAGGRAN